jgi:hypothetical protein
LIPLSLHNKKKERLVGYLPEFPPGSFVCRPKPPTDVVQPEASHTPWPPPPPTNPDIDSNPWPKPPALNCGLPDWSRINRPPLPPGVSIPSFLKLDPSLHTVSVSLQFTFANAGLAALKLDEVTAAIIAAVVIDITKNLVFCNDYDSIYSYLLTLFFLAVFSQ